MTMMLQVHQQQQPTRRRRHHIRMKSITLLLQVLVIVLVQQLCNKNIIFVHSFSIVYMGGARRGGQKGNLQRILNDNNDNDRGLTKQKQQQSKGQLITGVTLPTEGKLKGWELGDKTNSKRVVCANVNNQYYVLQGDCPRCGFDLWRGDILSTNVDTSDATDMTDVWDDLPRVACPTCATTYSLRNGTYGPQYKRSGFLQNFVSNLAKQSTSATGNANKNAKSYTITVDNNTGNVYLN